MSAKLERLRLKHQKLRDKSLEKIEESRQHFLHLEANTDSSEDSISCISSVGVDLVGSSFFSFDLSQRSIVLPQHEQITLEEENGRLKKQLAELTADHELTRSQQKRQAALIRQLKESLSFDEIDRLRKRLDELTADRDRLINLVSSEIAKQQQTQKNELHTIRQQLTQVQKQLHLAQGKLRRQDFPSEEWSHSEAHRISKLLNGLEIRDPDSQKQLQELRGWFDKWTKIATPEQGAQGKQQRRISATEVDVLTAEAEEVIRSLQTLRAKLNEMDDENEDMIQGLEHQIEQQLQRWSELEERMDQISKPIKELPPAAAAASRKRPLKTTSCGEDNKVAEDGVNIALQAEKVQVLFLEIRTLANRNTNRQRKQSVQKPKGVDPSPDKDRWFSSFFTPQPAGAIGTIKKPERKLQPHASRDADNATDNSKLFSSFFAPPKHQAGVASKEPKVKPLDGQKIDNFDQIPVDSSSSSGEDYYPASHMEVLGSIFEYETRADSGSLNSTDEDDNWMDEDDKGRMSIEGLMCEEGVYYDDKRALSTDESDNLGSSSSSSDDSEEKGSDTSDSASKSSGFEVASNQGDDTSNVEADLDMPQLVPINDETSRSDDDSSIRSKEDKETKGLDGSESDSSGYEVASNQGDATIEKQADSEAPEVAVQSKKRWMEPMTNDDGTSSSGDDDSSIRSNGDKEAEGLDGSESDSSGYEVASSQGDDGKGGEILGSGLPRLVSLSKEDWGVSRLRMNDDSTSSSHDSSGSIQNVEMTLFGSSDSDSSSDSSTGTDHPWDVTKGHRTIENLMQETTDSSMYEDHHSLSKHEQASLSCDSSSQNLLSQSQTELMKAMLSEYGSSSDKESSEESSIAGSSLEVEDSREKVSDSLANYKFPNVTDGVEGVEVPPESALDNSHSNSSSQNLLSQSQTDLM
jgi:hypothetical protein